jgi:hypothetical protein
MNSPSLIAQFFASFNLAKQLYDVLMTWDRIGYIDIML